MTSRPPVSLALPGIPAPVKARPLHVVKWIEGLRAKIVEHLKDEMQVLANHGRGMSGETLAQYRAAEKLLAEIEGE